VDTDFAFTYDLRSAVLNVYGSPVCGGLCLVAKL
jgi:hypothetical protein